METVGRIVEKLRNINRLIDLCMDNEELNETDMHEIAQYLTEYTKYIKMREVQ